MNWKTTLWGSQQFAETWRAAVKFWVNLSSKNIIHCSDVPAIRVGTLCCFHKIGWCQLPPVPAGGCHSKDAHCQLSVIRCCVHIFFNKCLHNDVSEILGQDSSKPGNSCKNILESGFSVGDGEYWIRPGNEGQPFKAYCDMKTDGGKQTSSLFQCK